ncbi:50S ribosomal protein L11 methyltransferase [Azohydromonas sediminis]|uniref:50S ribosomal protein L11 methyltransferase n=1 Tax=Azohydromonas sediminis TaxID=2259674 RepID=UPI000E64F43D|nr:50S ribosomal protein L11 methyltransferase [Azohydromonas sediminis]
MHELVLQAPQPLVEALADALLGELDALSVSVEDADAGSEQERPLFGEPGLPPPPAAWPHSTLRALFASEAQATDAATLLAAHDDTRDVRVLAIAPVPEADWVRQTQAQFAPVEITPAFWIVPSWHAPPPQAERVIRLDPGQAFGTGTHATTRMCLRWIATQPPARRARWQRVLDYGCGSGILAIGAALHGAREVDAVDIDTAAIEATRANAAANGVAVRAGPPELAQARYALVLANILAQPLKLLAPLLAGHVDAGGDLVLAGILERQADELRAAYAPWCALDVVDRDEGWVLMHAAFAG